MKITLLIMLSVLMIGSCRFISGERVDGNGQISTEQRPLAGFKGVESHGSFDLFVSSGATHAVSVETDQNIQEYIDTYVENDVLVVTTKKRFNVNPSKNVKIYVTAPEYTVIESSGSGNITSQNLIKGGKSLEVGISGSGNVQLTVNADELESGISGSGTMKLSGTANEFNAQTSGSGDIFAIDLKTKDTEIDIAGSGNAEVFVTDKLSVSIAGSGDVKYKGGAKLSSKVSGSGSVSNME